MLRSLIFALVVAAPGLAAAEDFPQAVVGMEVRGEHGVVLGRVTAVQRNRQGRVVSATIPGLEPPDAATVRPQIIAQDGNALRVRSLIAAISVASARVQPSARAFVDTRSSPANTKPRPNRMPATANP